MDCVLKYQLEFKAMLCPVVSKSLNDIARMSRALPRKNDTKDDKAYLSRSDETHRFLKETHRTIIYLTVTSYKFVEKIPVIKDVDALNRTEYDKMVILMIVLGLTVKEIADMLMTDLRTIASTKSKLSRDIENLTQKIVA